MGKRKAGKPDFTPTKRKRCPTDAKSSSTKHKPKIDSLTDLNSDCLLKVFEFLDIKDLCNIAECCQTLRNLAKYHFRVKCKHVEPIIEDINMAEKLFRNFGDQMYSLCIWFDWIEDPLENTIEILRLINQYCAQNLKVLWLHRAYKISADHINELQPLFESIEILKLNDCSSSFISGLTTYSMNNLEKLSLIYINCEMMEFSTKIFPNLKEVELTQVDRLRNDQLRAFINLNRTLKTVSIVRCFHVTSAVFDAIGQLENLEKFSFQKRVSENAFRNHLMQLSSLKKLKMLNLHCNTVSVLDLLKQFSANDVPIEYLELANAPINDGTAEAIASLKTIKVLKLNEMIDFAATYAWSIVKKLEKLDELYIKTRANIYQFGLKKIMCDAHRLSCLQIDASNLVLKPQTYHAALDAIQKRTQAIPLVLTIYGNGDDQIVPKEMLKKDNEKYLTVHELNRDSNYMFRYTATLSDDESDEEFTDDDDDDDDLSWSGEDVFDGSSDEDDFGDWEVEFR